MKREELNPAAVVRQQAELRILKAEARGLNKRINDADRATLAEYRELGKRLAPIREALKHGEWLPALEEMGIPSQRASEAISVFEFWWKFPDAGSLNEFLAWKATYKGRGKLTPQIPGTAGNLTDVATAQDGQPDGGSTDATTPETPDPSPAAPEPPPDIGDACEQPPPGLITDPDGSPLPAATKDAWEAAGMVEEALEPLRAACKAVDAFAATAAGAYVDARHIKTRIRAAAVQIKNKVLRPDNTFRCDGHQGHGCTGNASCAKCEGRLVIPGPMKGDLGPKAKPYHGRRR